MAVKRLNINWPVFIGVIFVVAVLCVYGYYTDKKDKDRITSDCQNNKYYNIPLISFIDRDSTGVQQAVIEIRRNGKALKNELGLKASLNTSKLFDLDLYSKNAGHPYVQKKDTIMITMKGQKHIFYGFSSNTVKVGRGFLLCHESYVMDGKPFNSSTPNSIDLTTR